jgi:aminomethyltransferase
MDARETANSQPTCLAPLHAQAGARMASFGGYLLPMQFRGILEEHHWTRRHVSLFDTCHMGELRVQGPGAAEDVGSLLTRDVVSLAPGRCRYALMCNERGGTLDDVVVYRLAADDLMLVVNAATRPEDAAWMAARLPARSRLSDVSGVTAKIDVQGPESPALLARILEHDVGALGYYRWMDNRFGGSAVRVSRTGYTGERGYEVYLDPDLAPAFWAAAREAGAEPAGLGARDTLRLEAGYPLYGHELAADRNAGESGLVREADLRREFVGAAAVREGARHGPRRLAGLLLDGRRAARAGDAVLSAAGQEVGVVTSGSFAPSLGKAVALGYIDRDQARNATRLGIRTARQVLEAGVAPLPFYRRGTARG